jgi:cytochrome c-type biogenesis protein CcmH
VLPGLLPSPVCNQRSETLPRLASVIVLIGLIATLLAPQHAFAVQPDEILQNPALESRARHLSSELRCLVCQNQSIDDSEAPLARDLRLLVRSRLAAGDSDQQVLEFLVARYGAFVLLRPPLQADTLLLWAVTPLALLCGIAGLIIVARRRKKISLQTIPLEAEEESKLEALLAGKIFKEN